MGHASGGADVTETFLRGETVLHRCTAALPAGADVTARSTGRGGWTSCSSTPVSISSPGLIHARFGYENVGFHLGADLVTIDFNGEVDEQALQELERAANEGRLARILRRISGIRSRTSWRASRTAAKKR